MSFRRSEFNAQIGAKLHKFYDGDFLRADQAGWAFRWSAHLHKKRGFCVRARRGNERALRGRIGSVLSAPIFAPLRLAAASFSVHRGGLRKKKSPCQQAAEGLTCGVVSYGRVGLCAVVVGVSGLASDCCLQQCVRVEAHHVDPQPVV